ncbi:unnamed protein product [Protopolystoma xenopodis]|uniref:Uncharacterized protein n=1 Tax=Protopolystoma xenopodis TaxID=117903 RepID=A0A448XEQ1_9PLAT|nr:unnamed protein product [Protopolystoma xenopodis]
MSIRFERIPFFAFQTCLPIPNSCLSLSKFPPQSLHSQPASSTRVMRTRRRSPRSQPTLLVPLGLTTTVKVVFGDLL